MKTRLFILAFLLVMVSYLPNCGVHASIVDYGVYKVEARITGDDTHPSLTKIDSKAPGIWSTGANAIVTDGYGSVTNSWSIRPLTANEARVNIAMGYTVAGSGYKYSYADEKGEVHFNYHSDNTFYGQILLGPYLGPVSSRIHRPQLVFSICEVTGL